MCTWKIVLFAGFIKIIIFLKINAQYQLIRNALKQLDVVSPSRDVFSVEIKNSLAGLLSSALPSVTTAD